METNTHTYKLAGRVRLHWPSIGHAANARTRLSMLYSDTHSRSPFFRRSADPLMLWLRLVFAGCSASPQHTLKATTTAAWCGCGRLVGWLVDCIFIRAFHPSRPHSRSQRSASSSRVPWSYIDFGPRMRACAYVRTHLLMCICTPSGDGFTFRPIPSHWGYHISRECVIVYTRTHKTRRKKRPAGVARCSYAIWCRRLWPASKVWNRRQECMNCG